MRHTSTPTVHVIVPVRNRWSFTHACLSGLLEQTYPSVEIVLVDDGSSDGTRELVTEQFPGVVLLIGGGNLWWTGATNLGLDWVLGQCADSDYVLTLNNDTRVDPGYIEILLRVASTHGPRTIVGSVAVDSCDGDTIFDGGPRVNWSSGKWWLENAGESLSRVESEGVAMLHADALPGRGTLIPVACFREIGRYDAARFPHYAADYEFAIRAARVGYELVMSYEAPVYAEVEATGIDIRCGRLPWSRFFRMFVSRRSSACLLYRWRFAVVAAPRGRRIRFLIADTVRLLGGALRDQLGIGRSARTSESCCARGSLR